jgi:hypothetical protein
MMTREELEERIEALVQSCPTIFGGAKTYRFECRGGWIPILNNLCDSLETLARSDYPDLRIVQIKEKFGGLRVYTEGAPVIANLEAVRTKKEAPTPTLVGKFINIATRLAEKTCEFCGEEGELRTEGMRWIRTLCDTHYAEERIRFLESDVVEARVQAERWRNTACARGVEVMDPKEYPLPWE